MLVTRISRQVEVDAGESRGQKEMVVDELLILPLGRELSREGPLGEFTAAAPHGEVERRRSHPQVDKSMLYLQMLPVGFVSRDRIGNGT